MPDLRGFWSGNAKALGRNFDTTCEFDGAGGFIAKAAGITVKGKYAVSGSKATLTARGVSMVFDIGESSAEQHMVGSGRYLGVKGHISLSRAIPDAREAL